jgi:hypothetical protein
MAWLQGVGVIVVLLLATLLLMGPAAPARLSGAAAEGRRPSGCCDVHGG